MQGVFILPGETVDAYLEYAGYSHVMYIHLKTGRSTMGWVPSSRLAYNHFGIAPPSF
jgi:hypothetical protein